MALRSMSRTSPTASCTLFTRFVAFGFVSSLGSACTCTYTCYHTILVESLLEVAVAAPSMLLQVCRATTGSVQCTSEAEAELHGPRLRRMLFPPLYRQLEDYSRRQMGPLLAGIFHHEVEYKLNRLVQCFPTAMVAVPRLYLHHLQVPRISYENMWSR